MKVTLLQDFIGKKKGETILLPDHMHNDIVRNKIGTCEIIPPSQMIETHPQNKAIQPKYKKNRNV